MAMMRKEGGECVGVMRSATSRQKEISENSNFGCGNRGRQFLKMWQDRKRLTRGVVLGWYWDFNKVQDDKSSKTQKKDLCLYHSRLRVLNESFDHCFHGGSSKRQYSSTYKGRKMFAYNKQDKDMLASFILNIFHDIFLRSIYLRVVDIFYIFHVIRIKHKKFYYWDQNE